MDLAAATTVGLKCALGHRCIPVCEIFKSCARWSVARWTRILVTRKLRSQEGTGEVQKTVSAARFEYSRVEEKRQRNTSPDPPNSTASGSKYDHSRILHNPWCNSGPTPKLFRSLPKMACKLARPRMLLSRPFRDGGMHRGQASFGPRILFHFPPGCYRPGTSKHEEASPASRFFREMGYLLLFFIRIRCASVT
jgi:hypothetical protein